MLGSTHLPPPLNDLDAVPEIFDYEFRIIYLNKYFLEQNILPKVLIEGIKGEVKFLRGQKNWQEGGTHFLPSSGKFLSSPLARVKY